MTLRIYVVFIFFFNDTATTEIYTLSLHDALPISPSSSRTASTCRRRSACCAPRAIASSLTPTPTASSRRARPRSRSEEHTSELQSRLHLVCRLLLEKKKPFQQLLKQNAKSRKRLS